MAVDYITYMTKMRSILKKPMQGFCCIEQMLLYHIVSPSDTEGRDLIMDTSSHTFASYMKKGKSSRNIDHLVSKIEISSRELSEFFKNIGDGDFEEYAFDEDFWILIKSSFSDEIQSSDDTDIYDECAILLEKVCLSSIGQRSKGNTNASGKSDSMHSDSNETTNIYNQTLFYTNGGNINVINNIEHLDTL